MLLTINVVLYVLWQFLRLVPGVGSFVLNHLALNPAFPGILFEPWQLITYNFLHLGGGFGGLLHILFNMLWLFWIGKEYEEMHGSHQLFALYIIGGVGGGLMSILLYPIIPGFVGGMIHGASASVIGLLMAVAILYPYKQIALFLLGTIRLLYIVVGFLIIDALLALSSSGVSVSAHWGGALAGFLFARAERGGVDLTSWAHMFFGTGKRSKGRKKKDKNTGFIGRIESWINTDEPDATRAARSESSSGSSRSPKQAKGSGAAAEEIDRILDKISEHGYESLSEEEKRTLYEASKS